LENAVLRQFELAQRIRETFFRGGSGMPSLQFTMTFTSLRQTVNRVVIELDGKAYPYQFGPERPYQVTWPGDNPGLAVITFEERGGAKPHDEFKGPWALFRLFESAQVRPEASERYLLTFVKGQHQAEVRIEAASVLNPFGRRDWQQFRCRP
jgi:type VI secretion system protein ImpL